MWKLWETLTRLASGSWAAVGSVLIWTLGPATANLSASILALLTREAPMRRWRSTALPLTLMSVLATPSLTLGQDIASDTLLTVGHYLELESVTDPQLSPDGCDSGGRRQILRPISPYMP